jgi:hypothetical protein
MDLRFLIRETSIRTSPKIRSKKKLRRCKNDFRDVKKERKRLIPKRRRCSWLYLKRNRMS